MKYLILQGSPRKNGNTQSLVEPFIEELEKEGHETEVIWLYDKKIEGCIACRNCQKDWTKFGCIHKDDGEEIFQKILDCDVFVFATPIYAWYCTAPMKALIDRLVYVMDKFYGDEIGPSIWEGKKFAIIATGGYKPERACDVYEEGMKRFAKHCHINYLSMYAERDLGYKSVFIDDEKIGRARAYAQELMRQSIS